MRASRTSFTARTPVATRGLAIAAAVVVLDQLTKWAILEIVMRPPSVIEVTPFFNLVLGRNTGISFGLFGDAAAAAWVLPLVAALVIAVLGVWLFRAERLLIGASLGFIIGGALGNLIDRFRHGAVIDFLDFHAMNYHWPAFNVADAAITVGAALLIGDSLLGSEEGRKTRPAEQEKS
jgi:signal peptidase II